MCLLTSAPSADWRERSVAIRFQAHVHATSAPEERDMTDLIAQ